MQAYLRPGLPTRCSLSNLISNTYNVPLWAEATLTFHWAQDSAASEAPSKVGRQPLEAAAALAPQPAIAPRAAPATAPLKTEAAAAAAGASVPDEVVPLTPREDDAQSMTVLAGQGDR
jgi:hypothetical protein